jgi:hypothetical protein
MDKTAYNGIIQKDAFKSRHDDSAVEDQAEERPI